MLKSTYFANTRFRIIRSVRHSSPEPKAGVCWPPPLPILRIHRSSADCGRKASPARRYHTGTSNVYTWPINSSGRESTQWEPLTDASTTFTPGRGVLMYVFSDDDGPDNETNAGFPKTLRADGFVPNTHQNLSSLLNPNPEGWTLLGNPFSQRIGLGPVHIRTYVRIGLCVGSQWRGVENLERHYRRSHRWLHCPIQWLFL